MSKRETYMEGAVAPGEVYSLEELEAMATLRQGHTDNLKIDTGDGRIWLSRMTVEDGEPCNSMRSTATTVGLRSAGTRQFQRRS